MAFNYKSSTDNELLQHISTTPSSTISVAKAYHTEAGNMDVVGRINTCRKVLKQRRILEQLEKLRLETLNYGIITEQCSSCVARPE